MNIFLSVLNRDADSQILLNYDGNLPISFGRVLVILFFYLANNPLELNYKNRYRILLFLLLACNLPFLVFWIKRRLETRINPFVVSAFLLAVLLLLIPVAIRSAKWIKKNWFEDVVYEPAFLFASGLISWNIFLLLSWDSTVDIHFRDTYYIIPIFYIVLAGSLFFGIFCLFYYVIARTNHKINIIYSRVHFWISYWSLCYIFLRIKINTGVSLPEGFMPRRYVEYQGWTDFSNMQHSNHFFQVIIILFMLAQALFVFNILNSLLVVRRNKQ